MPQAATLFIAISTGQNIVNLLPILELYKKGDRVLWVESATAKKGGWSTGSLKVRRRHGVPDADIEVLEVADDPSILQTKLAQHPTITAGKYQVKMVGNGGTKTQMLAAFRAVNGHLTELLYNHDQQCMLEHYTLLGYICPILVIDGPID